MTQVRDGWGREHRHHPIRRLTQAECDLLEYEGPLVLCEQQMRFLIGPWRPMKHLVVTHHLRGVMWEGTPEEFAGRGLNEDRPAT